MLVLHPQRRTTVLFAAKDGLLLLQRRPIPKFDVETNNTRSLIATANGPRRFSRFITDPYHLIH
ncbi:hypothetical protein D3C80_1930730 [compost metagenome]